MKKTAFAAALVLAAGLWAPLPAHAATFNVRDYGATGNGTTIDSPAIDRAISAANAAGGGIVEFPAGTYHSRSIHLKSNVTLQLNAGATIKAAASGIDNPEPNPYRQYQDFGHSHYHNSLMWGENVTNFAITGTGTIEGEALERGDAVPNGKGNKALALKMCSNVSIRDVTFRRGGHFAIIMNGCHDVAITNLKIQTKEDRDGINIINSWNVEVTNSDIQSSDDAIGIKSDYSMGRTFESHNIRVRNSKIHSEENNALQFGSETCGNFRDIAFENLDVTGAGKAGIGLVSMDGATISDVRYDNIRLTRTASAIFMKIGSRGRCPGKPPAGKIRDITINNVTGTNLVTPADVAGDDEYSPTLAGAVGAPIENIRMTSVKLTLPGGHPASDANRTPPEDNGAYPPRVYGVRPAFGFWMRHVKGIALVDSEFRFERNDGRPGFIVDDGAAVAISGVKVQRGTGSSYDVGLKSVRGYAIENSSTTTGAALRVNASNSTPLPGGDPVNVDVEAEAATLSAPMRVTADATASGGQYVAVAPGNNSQAAAPATGHAAASFTVPKAGRYKLWGRVIAPTTSDDSFWVRVDNGPWTAWNNIPLGAGWHWDDIHGTGDASTFDLAAGAHTVTFAYREDGARLDRIRITDDLTGTP